MSDSWSNSNKGDLPSFSSECSILRGIILHRRGNMWHALKGMERVWHKSQCYCLTFASCRAVHCSENEYLLRQILDKILFPTTGTDTTFFREGGAPNILLWSWNQLIKHSRDIYICTLATHLAAGSTCARCVQSLLFKTSSIHNTAYNFFKISCEVKNFESTTGCFFSTSIWTHVHFINVEK